MLVHRRASPLPSIASPRSLGWHLSHPSREKVQGYVSLSPFGEVQPHSLSSVKLAPESHP
jgi:hypothetical protein